MLWIDSTIDTFIITKEHIEGSNLYFSSTRKGACIKVSQSILWWSWKTRSVTQLKVQSAILNVLPVIKGVHARLYVLFMWTHTLKNNLSFCTCLTISPSVVCNHLTIPIYSVQTQRPDLMSVFMAFTKIAGENLWFDQTFALLYITAGRHPCHWTCQFHS